MSTAPSTFEAPTTLERQAHAPSELSQSGPTGPEVRSVFSHGSVVSAVMFYTSSLYLVSMSLVASVLVLNLSRQPHATTLPWPIKSFLTGPCGRFLLLNGYIEQVSHPAESKAKPHAELVPSLARGEGQRRATLRPTAQFAIVCADHGGGSRSLSRAGGAGPSEQPAPGGAARGAARRDDGDAGLRAGPARGGRHRATGGEPGGRQRVGGDRLPQGAPPPGLAAPGGRHRPRAVRRVLAALRLPRHRLPPLSHCLGTALDPRPCLFTHRFRFRFPKLYIYKSAPVSLSCSKSNFPWWCYIISHVLYPHVRQHTRFKKLYA